MKIMQDKFAIKVPAKINLFLKIINKRKDGYHNIQSGLTFINLYDEIKINFSNKFSLNYCGQFKPIQKYFENDIILKTIKLLNISEKLEINVKKNIPAQAGLGSASTNAAALIKFAFQQNLLKARDFSEFKKIGADVPACIWSKDCIISGIGENINTKVQFPKYFFVLIKPNLNFSTKKMYLKLQLDKSNENKILENIDYKNIGLIGNDFENILRSENNDIINILDYISSLNNCLFSRITGSGSCCYGVFKSKVNAKEAYNCLNKKFSNMWTFIGENNAINF